MTSRPNRYLEPYEEIYEIGAHSEGGCEVTNKHAQFAFKRVWGKELHDELSLCPYGSRSLTAVMTAIFDLALIVRTRDKKEKVFRVYEDLILRVLGVSKKLFEDAMLGHHFVKMSVNFRKPKTSRWRFNGRSTWIHTAVTNAVCEALTLGGRPNYYCILALGTPDYFWASFETWEFRECVIEVFTLLDHLQGHVHPLCIDLLREAFQKYYPHLDYIFRLFY